MKVFIDNQLIRRVKEEGDLLTEALKKEGILAEEGVLQAIFNWPALSECLDLGSLLEKLPKFDEQNQLFTLLLSNLERESVIYLYDQVFAECLTQIKGLEEIQPAFLIQRIQERRSAGDLFDPALEDYEKRLREYPYETIHDLTLYLGWDRVCVNLAAVFEYPDLKIRNTLEVLKECLLESFQHITAHGKTAPGFFRLIEALYAYQMREEHLQLYPDAEWALLCQSAPALRPREVLSDIAYIDAAVVDEQELQERGPFQVMTMDSPEKVRASLSLSDYLIEKLKGEPGGWRYTLSPAEIICLRESEHGLAVETVILH